MFGSSLLGTYALLVSLLLFTSCSHAGERAEQSKQEERVASARCPERVAGGPLAPNTSEELNSLSYWTSVLPTEQLDEPLLDAEVRRAQNLALRRASDGQPRFVELTHIPSSAELEVEVAKRLATWRERLSEGEYAFSAPDTQKTVEAALGAVFREQRALRVALAPILLRCGPLLEVVRSARGDPRFDRNACTEVRAQEPVEVLGKLGSLLVARSRYALGFIAADAPLSPVVPAELADTFRRGRELEVLRDLELSGQRVGAGTMLVAGGEDRAFVASPREVSRSRPLGTHEARQAERPFTRRGFLAEAFRHLGTPYGLGDENGGRDCSRFVLDVFRAFGLHLPRTSGEQSLAGTYVVEVPDGASHTERLGVLDEATTRGVVLLHFPGHIAIYLGRDKAGVPRLLHSFAEYLTPCDGGGETLVEVGRVAVSDLTLGKGTSRRSFLERMTRLTVFGKPPGHGLLALSTFRTAVVPDVPDACEDGDDVTLFRSPRQPHAGRSLRVIAVGQEEMRPAALWLVDPNGQLSAPAIHDLGVGPYARWAEVSAPAEGKWTALLADGPRVLACQRIRVRSAREGDRAQASSRDADAPAWSARSKWSPHTEALYAAFVEQLFGHSVDDLRSWSSLAELTRDPVRNLLFNHLGANEDTNLSLAPDCADLPYFLRGYFAWKLGLPFGYRHCSRGKAGVPPRCGPLLTQATPVAGDDAVAAFSEFIRRNVASAVHSASGRTLPDDLASDLYPLPLSREALRPGSVFIDPYGHMIVVARWVPQGLSGQGMLLGADAQPDATVGRRRFWRGNFLFTPDTQDVGAGFKMFRPLPGAAESESESERDSAEQKRRFVQQGLPTPSLVQYQGELDAFYLKLDELIYPRPIAIQDRMEQLVAALEEQVLRRVEAIDVGEAYMLAKSSPMPMPEGYSIFETQGPWEDFATPSRDMRLLIAMDAVQGFPAHVEAQPARFLASPSEVASVRERLSALLSKRRFFYTRSDGTRHELSLQDVMERSTQLEVAYNPNDCVETRWAAAPESDEHATCARKAPKVQRAAMESYRPWFRDRTRPARH